MTQTTGADIEGSGVEHPTFVPPVNATEDDPEPTAPRGGRNESFFTTEQLEKARREERDKQQREKARLKERNDAMAAELDELRKFREQQERERQAAERKAQKKQRLEEEKDLSAKEILLRREQEWEQQQQKWEQKFAQLEAKSRLENQAMQLQVYIQRRVAEEQAARTIAPQFVDYIHGSTPEEVEASIELAKQKTSEILAEVAGQKTESARQSGPSLRTGPSDIGSVTEIQDDGVDYTNMDMKTYLEKVRPKLGISGGNQGMFA